MRNAFKIAVCVGLVGLSEAVLPISAAASVRSVQEQTLVAMALFGGEESKPVPPPVKPVTPKPQAPAAPPGAGAVKPPSPGQEPAAVQPAPPSGGAKPGTAPQPSVAVPAGTPPAPQATGKPSTMPSAPATAPPPSSLPAQVSPATPASAAKTTPPVPPAGNVEPPKPAPGAAPSTAALRAGESPDGYSYDPKSRRDPFQSLTKMLKIDKSKSDLPPLQRVQLSDVKIQGIIWGGYGYFGLVQTPDGKGYTVQEGTLMGTNNGIIKAITEKAIIVSEPTIDMAGKKSTKETELLLRPKEVSQ